MAAPTLLPFETLLAAAAAATTAAAAAGSDDDMGGKAVMGIGAEGATAAAKPSSCILGDEILYFEALELDMWRDRFWLPPLPLEGLFLLERRMQQTMRAKRPKSATTPPPMMPPNAAVVSPPDPDDWPLPLEGGELTAGGVIPLALAVGTAVGRAVLTGLQEAALAVQHASAALTGLVQKVHMVV